MLDRDKREQLTDLMKNHFTDLDIERDEPFKFRSGKWVLIVETVRLLEHEAFLSGMLRLITRYKAIFYNLDFLSSQNYENQGDITRLINQVVVFQAQSRMYRGFLRDAAAFCARWGYVARVKREIPSVFTDGTGRAEKSGIVHGPLKRSRRRARRVLEAIPPDTFIYVLFLMFVRNYDIVKKNLLGFLQMFKPEPINTPRGTSSPTSKSEERVMPKYSASPYPKSVLETFARQSKTH